jgi:hypothetical protein
MCTTAGGTTVAAVSEEPRTGLEPTAALEKGACMVSIALDVQGILTQVLTVLTSVLGGVTGAL